MKTVAELQAVKEKAIGKNEERKQNNKYRIVVGMATCGMAAGAVYRLLKKKNAYLAMLCAAIICPIINTGAFVTCMMLFFKPVLSAWAGGTDIVTYVLTGLVLFNFVPEMILNIVFSPAGHQITRIVNKTK